MATIKRPLPSQRSTVTVIPDGPKLDKAHAELRVPASGPGLPANLLMSPRTQWHAESPAFASRRGPPAPLAPGPC